MLFRSEKIVYFATYLITDAKDEEIEKVLSDLTAQTDAARQAIKIRYEKESEVEGANVRALAEAQTKELEDLESDYIHRKNLLEGFHKGAVISEIDYRNLPEEYEDLIEVGMGATAIKKLLDEIDLDLLINTLKEESETAKGQKAKKIKIGRAHV